MGAKVFAVIPVHDGIENTVPTVRSLLPLMPPEGRIVVVDDGSTDGTRQVLQKDFPGVTVLAGDGNLWWSGATNLGSRYALKSGADYVLFLNNDVILHPQFLEELLRGARKFPGALIASKILSADEPWRLWSMGGRVDYWKGQLWMLGCGSLDDARWQEPAEADWLPGMSLLVPTEVFRQGIWVDEAAFPQYSGDSDFTIRARKGGFRLIVWPESRIYNKVRCSGLDTRLLLGAEPFSLRLFTQTLTSVKSSMAIRTKARWVFRHAPFWSWPTFLLRSYGYYLLKCLQIGSHLPAPRWRKNPPGPAWKRQGQIPERNLRSPAAIQ